jgi:beta-glucosidase
MSYTITKQLLIQSWQPVDAITDRAKADKTVVSSSLSDGDLNAAAKAAAGRDVSLVFITADSGEEGYIVEGNVGDRNDLQAWHNGVSSLRGLSLTSD